MRLLILPMIMFIIVNLVVDWYIWSVLRITSRRKSVARLHAATSALMLVWAIVIIALPRRSGGDGVLLANMWLLFGYLTVYVPKLLFAVLSLTGLLPRLWKRPPWRWPIWMAVAVAIALLVAMWWGALVTRNAYQVKEVELAYEELPSAFDGLRIVQFSDLHVGTYGSDTAYVARLVDAINALRPDIVFFTGDIVNRHSAELLPFIPSLSRLSAPEGVVSIMGNHDYGDYTEWPSPQAKADNVCHLHTLQADMGWKLMLNDHIVIRRGNDSIAIVGVENWGDPPFTVYGDLAKAYPTAADSTFKILLTHNPAHWIAEVAETSNANFALTLSGHTHAMQIEIAGWSPSKYRYPTWGGLYSDGSRHLYVNIGIGTVAMPMRIGATPEITIITLRRGPAATMPQPHQL